MIQVLEALGMFQMFQIPGTLATSRVAQVLQTLGPFGTFGLLPTPFSGFGYMFQGAPTGIHRETEDPEGTPGPPRAELLKRSSIAQGGPK